MKYKVLVNKENKIKDNYLSKVNLITTKNVLNEDTLIEEETYNNYLKLKEFIKEKLDLEIGIDTAYRDFSYQQAIYDDYLNKNGKDYCDKYVAEVGYSEHHTGLAIDIEVMIDGEFIYSDDKFNITEPVLKKIHPYLYKFGFILRYPENKENITGYNYEPWHIRYVGEIPAKIIYENNLTLEEYLKDFGCVLYINKPKDVTSYDVVYKISNLFGIKRVGHTGTLDPLATGVMLVCVGKATKIVELLTSEDKEYIAEVKLGIKTDTLDITGEVLEEKEVPSSLNLEEVLNSFKKTYLQEVPVYSAVKVKGKKLYEYARNNIDVELPKKEVTIKEIELLSNNDNTFTFRSLVTKGCYIRSLINDICKSLDTIGTMTSLVRTKQGNIFIEKTNTLEEIESNNYKYYKIEEVLDYPIVDIKEDLLKVISNGVKVSNKWNIKDKVIFTYNDKLLGIYEVSHNNLKVWKNFN
ncbi:MAG: tRNA pseudouridine(55) synthase TruB [Bacilli bacterium]|nr:tRNA pseudouridine(55) synthase TruB [Bacilli bacterium]